MFFLTGKDVPTSVRERLPESISNTFALIQSIEYSVGGNRTRQYWPLLNGPLNKSYTMENQFRIEDVTAITGPVTIIEDKLFVDSTKIQSCSVISDISTWTSYFYHNYLKAKRALIQLVIEVEIGVYAEE